MARIKYSALVTEIAGTIGGTTFQRNAYGYSIKAKPNMVNPNSSTQALRKQFFGTAVQKWAELTPTERSAWETYASTFPIPSRLNAASNLNGYNAFIRWHGINSLSSLTNTLANPSGAQGVVGLFDFLLYRTGADLTLEVACNPTAGPWRAFVFLSRPVSATKRYAKGWTRFIYQQVASGGFDLPITSLYTAKFGVLPVTGDSIAGRIVFLNTTNGQINFVAPSIVLVT